MGKMNMLFFFKGPFWDRYGKTMRQLWKKLWQNYMGKLLLWENYREKPQEAYGKNEHFDI